MTDPDAMIAELKEMGIELMVSIWPMVDYKSENFEEMKAKGLLTRVEKGVRIDNVYMGNTIQYDPTNPEAREYVWGKAKKNYYDKGVKIFWLDEAEPEYTVYDFENYRYHLGPNVQIGNVYPAMYAKTFFDGMRAEGQENVVNLLRCAWAGSQKYGALVWSGDIHSTFESLQNQFAAGLNMGLSGIPWWTTDIGGFFGANIYDEDYHEVFVRWFEYGTFCPVMRLHGYRMPYQPQLGTTGVAGDDDAARIAVMGIEDTPGMAFKIFNVLAKKNVNVDMILQSVGHNDKKDISFTVKEEELDIAVKALEDYLPDSYYEEIKASKEVAKVSIIGKGLLNHYGMAARMFNALYKADVNIRMISTSEIRVTVLVNQEDMVKAMNAAHEEFEM